MSQSLKVDLSEETKQNVGSSLRLAIAKLKETEGFIISAEGSLSYEGLIAEKDPLTNELASLRALLLVIRGALSTEADRLNLELTA